jgi:hypothetical protein
MSAEPAALAAIKSDWALFQSTTGIERPGEHHHCPFHPDRNGSLSVRQGLDGTIRWRCFAGCGQGTVIDALALRSNCAPAEVIRNLVGRYEAPNIQPVRHGEPQLSGFTNPPPPEPDRKRVAELLEKAIEYAVSGHPVAARYAQRRGLDLGFVADEFGVGFIPELRFAGWGGRVIQNAWVIPISGPDGRPVAVKLHREDPPAQSPKCLWAPFGTRPDPGQTKPRHAWSTLWPAPEWFGGEEAEERAAILELDGHLDRADAEHRAQAEMPLLFLTPGELKALAIAQSGRAATSVTGGESCVWEPALVGRLAGRRVVLVYDDDPAGHAFRDRTALAIVEHVAELKCVTFRQQGVE